MAEGARDWTKFLKGRPEVASAVADLAAAVRPGANDPDDSAAESAADAVAASLDAWSETLARVHGAADLLRTRENQLRDLEQRHQEAMERAAERIAALEGQLAAEAERAQLAEQARAQAEEWLGRIPEAVLEKFPPG
jgi:small-conductance mechanosensitive channel